MADGILDNKVVLVTGAGRGIGAEVAKLAAAEGAKVVVNDLGGSVDGGEQTARPRKRWLHPFKLLAAKPS